MSCLGWCWMSCEADVSKKGQPYGILGWVSAGLCLYEPPDVTMHIGSWKLRTRPQGYDSMGNGGKVERFTIPKNERNGDM